MVIPVVEIGARLPGNGERVFESRSGDEGDARAFAFEQCVGGDGGAVADFDSGGRNEGGDSADGFEDGAARIVGRGGKFEHVDAAADAVDAVSEGAAGIDGDGEVRSHSRKHNRQGQRFCRQPGRGRQRRKTCRRRTQPQGLKPVYQARNHVRAEARTLQSRTSIRVFTSFEGHALIQTQTSYTPRCDLFSRVLFFTVEQPRRGRRDWGLHRFFPRPRVSSDR